MAQHRYRRVSSSDTGISGLVIQLLTTEWMMDSREVSEARWRDVSPLASALPESWGGAEDGGCRVHTLDFSEWRRFEPREGLSVRKGRTLVEELEAFRVERTGEGLRVLLDVRRMGLPGANVWNWALERGHPGEELFRLSPGEWGRAVYTERVRYWETNHWGQCKHVLNVGLLRDARRDVFLATEPRHLALRRFVPGHGRRESQGAGATLAAVT